MLDVLAGAMNCMTGCVCPTDRVKAKLLESQSPVVNVTTQRKERLMTAANLYAGMNRMLAYLRRLDIG